jgi:hypothetical protein
MAAHGGIRLRRCGRPNAFGNALGNSLADELGRGSQQEDRVGQGGSSMTMGDFARMDGASYRSTPYDAGAAWMADVAGRRAANPMYTPALAQDELLGGRDDVNGMDLQSDQYRAPRTYTVQRGDNPASIGRTFFGDERAGAAILAANGLNASVRGARGLQIGQVLTLPDDISEGNLRAGGRLIGADTSIRAQEAAAAAATAAADDQARYDAMRVGAWSGRTSQAAGVGAAMGGAGGGAGGQSFAPGTDNSYYVPPGFITSSYNQGVAMMSNGPWYDRVIGGVAATVMAPMMLLEETGRASMNVPFYGNQIGQNAAQFALATEKDQRVIAGLNFVSNTSAGLLGGLAVVPGSVSMRAPVLTAQDLAVSQFAGAEVNAAARTTYAGDVYSSRFVGPVQWEHFYRGDATQRTSFLSSMAQERGLLASTEFLSNRSGVPFTDMYATHGNIGSQGLPTIGVSKDPIVADYFARGSQQNQNGFVTTFRIESREAQSVAFRNFENRYDVFNINPNIGRMEQEYIFHNQIDKKYIFQQQPVRSR